MEDALPTKLRFEEAKETLLPFLQVIEDEAYPEPWTTGMFREEIRNHHSFFYVAYNQEKLVGYAGFWLLLDDAHITTVTTQKELRGRGYGREQMLHLITKAHQLDARRMTLEVRPSNTAARSLYDRLGFHEIGIRKGYYAKSGEDALVLELQMETV